MGVKIKANLFVNASKRCENFSQLQFDYLLFDLNHLVYRILEDEDVRAQINSDPQLLDLFYSKFFDYIRCIIQLIKPTKLIYFAFDGVSPRAKHRTQLIRRLFRKLGEPNRSGAFNFDCISVGTEFMHRLHLKFEDFVESLKSEELANNSGREVEYSSCYSVGEGEFKIFDFIDKSGLDKDAYFVLYGRDCDYLLYGLASKLTNLLLMSKHIELKKHSSSETSPDRPTVVARDGTRDGTFCTFDVIDLNHVREFIKSKLVEGGLKLANFDENRIFCDLIFVSLLLGSDYLFPVPGLARLNEDGNGFLEIVKMYAVHLQADGSDNSRPDRGYLTNETNKGFCAPNLQSYINSIAYLERKKFDERKSEDRPKGFGSVRVSYYETAGYEHSPNADQLKKLTRHYVRTMYFNLQLYYCNLLSWTYHHELFWPPLLSDFQILDNDIDLRFDMGIPVEPFLYLVWILPRESCDLLPPEFKEIKFRFVNSDKKFYSLDSCLYPKELRLPKIAAREMKIIQKHVQRIVESLSPEASQRNALIFDTELSLTH